MPWAKTGTEPVAEYGPEAKTGTELRAEDGPGAEDTPGPRLGLDRAYN